MATRNLARTVVEGGRAGYSKWERKARNRSNRRLRFDAEGDIVAGKPRRASGRGFADRLSPLRRWIEAQVGRGWNNVYREFCARIDRRTLKGWHLEDHLLGEVQSMDRPWGRFFVDPQGILRRIPRNRARQAPVPPCTRERALAWAAGRRVVVQGEALFWTARVLEAENAASPQGRRLTEEERRHYHALPRELREEIAYTSASSRGQTSA